LSSATILLPVDCRGPVGPRQHYMLYVMTFIWWTTCATCAYHVSTCPCA